MADAYRAEDVGDSVRANPPVPSLTLVSRRTSTSNFGAGKRESHNAAGFYARFPRPIVSSDDTVVVPRQIAEPFQCADARSMASVHDGEVALVVTSPPYFAGKQYEEELERDGVPSSYGEFLDLLGDVFSECRRVLEPGGRIAVNVANLGRKPYRSLSADIVTLLSDLGLLLRGEIVWRKGAGASGSCAWGSYRSPANPVLRDLTERVIVASKGRFDRARTAPQREAAGLPFRTTITADEFMASTLDVWELAPESAKRIGHPAPFPVGLPERLIHLYTYENDLVLDPFMGSGSSLVAASRTGRRYVGFDTDPTYVELARGRVSAEGARSDVADPASLAAAANALLAAAGAEITRRDYKVAGLTIDAEARDAGGRLWATVVVGGRTVSPAGLHRVDAAWGLVGRVHALRAAGVDRVLVLTSMLPAKGTESAHALRTAPDGAAFVAVDDAGALERLRGLFESAD